MLEQQYPVVHLCPVGEDGKAEGYYIVIPEQRYQPFRKFPEPMQVRAPDTPTTEGAVG